jgi:hypothetical protein
VVQSDCAYNIVPITLSIAGVRWLFGVACVENVQVQKLISGAFSACPISMSKFKTRNVSEYSRVTMLSPTLDSINLSVSVMKLSSLLQ